MEEKSVLMKELENRLESLNVKKELLENEVLLHEMDYYLSELQNVNEELSNEEIVDLFMENLSLKEDSITIYYNGTVSKEVSSYSQQEDGTIKRSNMKKQIDSDREGNPIIDETYSESSYLENTEISNSQKTKETKIDRGQGRDIIANTTFEELENYSQLDESYWSEQANNQSINDEKTIGDNVGYVARRTGAGIVSGIGGVGQAVMTEAANNMNESEEKSGVEIVTEGFQAASSTGALTIDYDDIIEYEKKVFEIVKDKDKSIPEKMAGIFVEASTVAINSLSAKRLFDTTCQLYGKLMPSLGEKTMEAETVMSDAIGNMNQELSEEGEEYGTVTQTAGNVGQTIGNMAPSLLVSYLTQNPELALSIMGISAKGQATQEAINQGAELDDAVKVGNAKGMVEVGTEKLTGGLKIFGGGTLDDVTNSLTQGIENEVVQKIADEGIGIGGEVLEETISDVAGTYIDRATVDPDASYSYDDWTNTAITTTLSTVVLNMITRGLVGPINNQQIEYESSRETNNTNEKVNNIALTDENIDTTQSLENSKTETTEIQEIKKDRVTQVTAATNKLYIESDGLLADFDKVVNKYKTKSYIKEDMDVILNEYGGIVVPLTTVERMNGKVNNFTADITDKDTELEKFTKLAMSIRKNTQNTYNNEMTYSESFSNGVIDGKTNSNGLAYITKAVFEAQGIETRIVQSDTNMWNEVKIDGQWYNFDMSAYKSDLSMTNIGKYLKSDEQMQKSKKYAGKKSISSDGQNIQCDTEISQEMKKEIKSLAKENQAYIPKVNKVKNNIFDSIKGFFTKQQDNTLLPEPTIKENINLEITNYAPVGKIENQILWEIQSWDKSDVDNKINTKYILLPSIGTPIDIYNENPEVFKRRRPGVPLPAGRGGKRGGFPD